MPLLPTDRTGRRRIALVLGILLSALPHLGYVLPAERVLALIAEKRRGAPPVRLTVEVERPGEEEPLRAWVELHPGGGWRIVDDGGQRWAGQGPQIRRIGGPPPPIGLAEAWLLAISDEERITQHVSRLGVDLSRNQLARCGEADCFVLGGRRGRVQLWVDKDRFEVRRYRNPQGVYLHFNGRQEVGGALRMPTRIRVEEPEGLVLEVTILEAEAAPHLRRDPELAPPAVGGPGQRHH